MKNYQKCYFKVSEKIEKMHACISYVDTCADFGIKNDHV
jgi:hypothetical protein